MAGVVSTVMHRPCRGPDATVTAMRANAAVLHPDEGRRVPVSAVESAGTEHSTPYGAQVRNNNSSRFGKFVEMHFDYNNALMGATIQARARPDRTPMSSEPYRDVCR